MLIRLLWHGEGVEVFQDNLGLAHISSLSRSGGLLLTPLTLLTLADESLFTWPSAPRSVSDGLFPTLTLANTSKLLALLALVVLLVVIVVLVVGI